MSKEESKVSNDNGRSSRSPGPMIVCFFILNVERWHHQGGKYCDANVAFSHKNVEKQ